MEISNNVRLLLLFVIINSQKIMLILLIYFSQSNITFSFISHLFLPFSFVKEILRSAILLTARNDATVREINKYSNSTIKNRHNFSERIYDSIADQSLSIISSFIWDKSRVPYIFWS